jgi:hypothetical protein
MRIAVVTPYLAAVLGNRGAFVLARALARDHDVTVLTDVVATPVEASIRALLAPARLEALTSRDAPQLSMGRLMWRQIVRGTDRAIARRLEELHRANPFDAVFVRSDEGHWLGEYVRRWTFSPRPITILGVLDLLDHPFLLRHERSHPELRGLATVAYPWLHRVEDRRLRAFDGLVTNSRWTTTLLDYLYGLGTMAEIDAYDDVRFDLNEPRTYGEPYLAVPTASLDAATSGWVERLHDDGVPLRLYGPRTAGRVPTAGFLADADMAELLRGARATLFLFDYEAFGLIPVESLAVGTPVITLAKGGPYTEHRTNSHVQFVRTYPETLAACRAAVARTPTPVDRAACRASVEAYRPHVGAAQLVRAIEALRSARASGR